MSDKKDTRPCRGCWTLYDGKTGIFSGTYAGSRRGLELNTPAGMKAIEGRFDPQTHRVDIETGEVVSYQAPPDEQRERARIHARIAALEAKQRRRVRELLAQSDPQLQEIDAEIVQLRADVTQNGR